MTNVKKKTDSSKSGVFATTFVVITFFMFLAIIIFSFQNSKRITLQNRDYLIDNTQQMAENIDTALMGGYDNIKAISALFGDSLKSPEVDVTNIQEIVSNSVFDFMEFADTEGMDHNITGGVSDARDRKYYLDAMKGNTGMELIYKSRATFETLLMFYSPVYYEGDIVGSLVGVYQAKNKIQDLLKSDYFGDEAISYLCNEEGRIVASSGDFEPGTEMYVYELASDSKLLNQINECLTTKKEVAINVSDYEAGAYMINLKGTGWYVYSEFPETANKRMIAQANQAGYLLVAFILALYILVLLGITNVNKLQNRLIENANNAKTEFLFNMSHDIRTPMNAITGFTAIAKKYSDDPDKVLEYLNKIETSGQQLSSLINQVLEMSRIESGKMELNEEVVDVVERFESLSTIFAAQTNTKSINYNPQISNIVHKKVYADDIKMGQIVLNIVSNACKYTHEGGNIDYIFREIESEKPGYATYEFIVKDDGIGMSEEFQKKLFEPFSREKSSTVSKIQGTGLGLAIVKNLVDFMGGRISVSSELGKGTEFDIIVNLRIAEYDEEEKIDTIEFKIVNFRGKRVLLVEDNEMNREIAKELLEEKGVIVEEAEDGDVAVEMMKETEDGYYDFILMDIQMPRMNGYDATRAIRQLPNIKTHLPIIAMTANAFEEDRQNALKAGMDDHLTKPIDITRLWETLSRYTD